MSLKDDIKASVENLLAGAKEMEESMLKHNGEKWVDGCKLVANVMLTFKDTNNFICAQVPRELVNVVVEKQASIATALFVHLFINYNDAQQQAAGKWIRTLVEREQAMQVDIHHKIQDHHFKNYKEGDSNNDF